MIIFMDNGFNPRPPLLTGEALRPLLAWPDRHGFNPRPPLLTGEASECGARLGHSGRFQSTPAIADGRSPPPHTFDALSISVSIHARHC